MPQSTPLMFPNISMNIILEHCNGSSSLTHLGVIECKGEEAAHFLHNQLTQDVLTLPNKSTTFSAFCNAKGRIQASFYVFKGGPDHLLLILPKELLAQTLKRLSMFVLRAKVKLHDASEQYCLLGLIGDRANSFLNEQPQTMPAKSLEAFGSFESGSFDPSHAMPQWSTIHSAQGHKRLIVCAAKQDIPQELLNLAHPSTSPAWALGEILCAVPLVTSSSFELFVPQMLNYESVGGVSFKKGCYPGQEVVARSQFRGTLKRRTAIVMSSLSLKPNQELYAQGSLPGQEAQGEVIQSVQLGNTCFATACLQLQILDSDANLKDGRWELIESPTFTQALQCKDESGKLHDLGLLPLPYPLMKDI